MPRKTRRAALRGSSRRRVCLPLPFCIDSAAFILDLQAEGCSISEQNRLQLQNVREQMEPLRWSSVLGGHGRESTLGGRLQGSLSELHLFFCRCASFPTLIQVPANASKERFCIMSVAHSGPCFVAIVVNWFNALPGLRGKL